MKIVYVHMGWPMAYPFSPRTWSQVEWERWLTLMQKNGVEKVMLWPGYEFIDPDSSSEIETMAEWTRFIIHTCHTVGLGLWLGRSINAVCNNNKNKLACRDVRDTETILINSQEYSNKIAKLLQYIFKNCQNFEGWWCIDRDPGACMGTTPQAFAKAYEAQFKAVHKAQQAIYWMWGGWTDILNQQAQWREKPQAFWKNCVSEMLKLFPDLHLLYCWPGHVASLEGLNKGNINAHAFPYHFGEPEPSIPWTHAGPLEPSYNFNLITNKTLKACGPQESIFNLQTPCLRTPYLIQCLSGNSDVATSLEDIEKSWCWSESSLQKLRENWSALHDTLQTMQKSSSPRSCTLEPDTSAQLAYSLTDWINFTGAHYPSKRGYLHERFLHA
jgi:hypothetical protein